MTTTANPAADAGLPNATSAGEKDIDTIISENLARSARIDELKVFPPAWV